MPIEITVLGDTGERNRKSQIKPSAPTGTGSVRVIESWRKGKLREVRVFGTIPKAGDAEGEA